MKKKFIYIIIFIIILVLFFIIIKNKICNKEVNSINESWEIKYEFIEEDTKVLTAETKLWDEMENYEKFNSLEYNDNVYNSKEIEIENNYIENAICEITLSTYNSNTKDIKILNESSENDEISDVEYFIDAIIYKINNISENCAIALKFENDTKYYVYINLYYTPETLGELIEDLNLKETISINSILYNYYYTDANGLETYDIIEFESVEDIDIWNMLFSDYSLENEYDNNEFHENYLMCIYVNIIQLGYENISINITEDGFLITNILDTEKDFYIGEDKVQEFVDYIVENYIGYKIVYIYEDDENYTDTEENTILIVKNDIISNIENDS